MRYDQGDFPQTYEKVSIAATGPSILRRSLDLGHWSKSVTGKRWEALAHQNGLIKLATDLQIISDQPAAPLWLRRNKSWGHLIVSPTCRPYANRSLPPSSIPNVESFVETWFLATPTPSNYVICGAIWRVIFRHASEERAGPNGKKHICVTFQKNWGQVVKSAASMWMGRLAPTNRSLLRYKMVTSDIYGDKLYSAAKADPLLIRNPSGTEGDDSKCSE